MKDSSACNTYVDSVFGFSRAVRDDPVEWDIALEGTGLAGGVVCFGTQHVVSIVVLGLWTH
jgi:hypothetical protein